MDMPTSSSRILYDVPCAVCKDHSSGKHYGVFACDGCAGFFKRSVRRDRQYACKARNPGSCIVDKAHRNQCRACRFAKCLDAGMNRDAVQHERGPRNSTIRRQIAMLMREQEAPPTFRRSASPIEPHIPRPGINPTMFNNMNFPDPNLTITINPPYPPLVMTMMPMTEPEPLNESAARLLFANVKWVKGLSTFEELGYSDRMLLLEESWTELFVLGATQFLTPAILRTICDALTDGPIRSELQTMGTVISEILQLKPDMNEFSCLRAMALFKTSFPARRGSSQRTLQDLPAVAGFQNQSQKVLTEYIIKAFPLQLSRLHRLMHLVPLARTVSNTTIVELFFRDIIGDSPIERIVCDTYRSDRNFA